MQKKTLKVNDKNLAAHRSTENSTKLAYPLNDRKVKPWSPSNSLEITRTNNITLQPPGTVNYKQNPTTPTEGTRKREQETGQPDGTTPGDAQDKGRIRAQVPVNGSKTCSKGLGSRHKSPKATETMGAFQGCPPSEASLGPSSPNLLWSSMQIL